MNVQKVVGEIIERWNSGDKPGAKRLLIMSQWLLPKETKEFLNNRLGLKVDTTVSPLAKQACDILGGKVTNEIGKTLYENQNPKKEQAGEEDTKRDTGVADQQRLFLLEKQQRGPL